MLGVNLLFFFSDFFKVCLHEDATAEMLIDVIEGNRVYIPCLYIVNKIDAITVIQILFPPFLLSSFSSFSDFSDFSFFPAKMEELEILDRIPNYVPISAYKGWNIDELLEMMWRKLNMVRVYTKPRGQVKLLFIYFSFFLLICFLIFFFFFSL